MKPLSKNNNDQAVTYGHVNAAEMLVNKGADPNIQSVSGEFLISFDFKLGGLRDFRKNGEIDNII